MGEAGRRQALARGGAGLVALLLLVGVTVFTVRSMPAGAAATLTPVAAGAASGSVTASQASIASLPEATADLPADASDTGLGTPSATATAGSQATQRPTATRPPATSPPAPTPCVTPYETRVSTDLHPGDLGAISVYCSCGSPDCTVTVALPSGGQAVVTGPQPAAPANQWLWTFKIPASEDAGTAILTLKCGSRTQTFNITITAP